MPFIMNAEGVGRLFALGGMAEGPFPEHYEPFETPLEKNPLSPKVLSNPAARVFPSDKERFGTAKEFPFVATTYRVTEHFHFWTKHTRIAAVLQPEAFVEIGEALAKLRGITNGDMVVVRSKRGQIKVKAVVTKRIRPLQIEGKEVHTVGLPLHWGFEGLTKKSYLVNTLTPFGGRRQHPDARVQGVPRGHRRRHRRAPWRYNRWTSRSRSATTFTPPSARKTLEVAKLIDVSRCIGCKACQAACMEWNDLRDRVGLERRSLHEPAGPLRPELVPDALHRGARSTAACSGSSSRTAASTAPTRAASGPAPPPAPSCSTPTASWTSRRRTASAAATASAGCPFNIPRLRAGGLQDLQVHALLRPGRGRARAGLHQDLPHPGALLRLEGGHARARPPPAGGPERARLQARRRSTTRRAWTARTSSSCCRTATAPRRTDCRRIRR